jgi:hypothetical protein
MKIVIETANQSMFFFCVIIISKYFLMGVTKIKKLKKTTWKNVIIRKTRVGKTQKGGAMKPFGVGRSKAQSHGSKKGNTQGKPGEVEGPKKLQPHAPDVIEKMQEAKTARQKAFNTGVIGPLKKALADPNITPERRNKLLLQIAESQAIFGKKEANMAQQNKAKRRKNQGIEEPRKKRKGNKAKVLNGQLKKATETAEEKKAKADKAKGNLATLESKVGELAGTVELAKSGAPPAKVAESVTALLTGLGKQTAVIEGVKQNYGIIGAANMQQYNLIEKQKKQSTKIGGYAEEIKNIGDGTILRQERERIVGEIAELQKQFEAPAPKGIIGKAFAVFRRKKTDLRRQIERKSGEYSRLPAKMYKRQIKLQGKIVNSQKKQETLQKSINELEQSKANIGDAITKAITNITKTNVNTARSAAEKSQFKANVATQKVTSLQQMADTVAAQRTANSAAFEKQQARKLQNLQIKYFAGQVKNGQTLKLNLEDKSSDV